MICYRLYDTLDVNLSRGQALPRNQRICIYPRFSSFNLCFIRVQSVALKNKALLLSAKP